jgi:hypothetical protein
MYQISAGENRSPILHRNTRRAGAQLAAFWLANGALGWSAALAAGEVPRLDHVVVVIMENRSYDDVRFAPYMASLIAASSSFSNSHALMHPSQPNYIALWSGSTQGVRDDYCPPIGSPFAAENLGHACEAAGLTWRGYSENLPSPGWTGCSAGTHGYRRRHAPWTHFSNLNHAFELPYPELAIAETTGALPPLSFVIPNNCNNSHDCPVSTGDAWLATHLPGMLRAVGPRGVVILTWDEDDRNAANQILTVFAGPMVRPGYVSGQPITHYTVLRTICDALGLAPFGAATSETPITDIWLSVPSALNTRSWGAAKSLFR